MYIKFVIRALILMILASLFGCKNSRLVCDICDKYEVKRATFYKEDYDPKQDRVIFRQMTLKNHNLIRDSDKTPQYGTPIPTIKYVTSALDSLGVINPVRDTIFCVRREPSLCIGCPDKYIFKTLTDTLSLEKSDDVSGKAKIGTLQEELDNPLLQYRGKDKQLFCAVFNWEIGKIISIIRKFDVVEDGDRIRVMRIIVENNKIQDYESIECF